MSAEFTPGPWKVYRTDSGAILGIGDADAGGVTDYQGGFWRDGKEKRANINLVAAAPELYEALQQLLDCCTSDDPYGAVPLIAKADAALAKARGEADQ